MGAKRVEYQIVGRYMDGSEVTGYHLQSLETGKEGRYDREAIAYLVGRGQITNCEGQIYKDKLLLRGKGMSLNDLPVVNEKGDLRNADGLGRVKRGTAAGKAITQCNLVGSIINGRNVVGYVLQNSGGGQKPFKREEVLAMAKAGHIGNARVQQYQGNMILKGVNCELRSLPKYDAKTMQPVTARG